MQNYCNSIYKYLIYTAMKIKLEHIAQKTGYSIATVSRVMAGKAVGHSKSVEKILIAARELGYRNQRINYNIEKLPLEMALVTQHNGEEFYSCLYESFDRIANKNNIRISFNSVRFSAAAIDELKMISHFNDGIILLLPTFESKDYIRINEELDSFPIVSIAPISEKVITTITFDSYQGGQLAAKLLIDSGYKRFGIISGPLLKWEAKLRRSGYIDYLNSEGHKITWEYNGDYSFESGEDAFKDVKRHKRNVGIFSSNDQMALGFIHSALENGSSIPGDYGVVGYDNMPYGKIYYPKLSSIDASMDDLADNALGYLINRIKNSNDVQKKPTMTLLPVSTVERNTH